MNFRDLFFQNTGETLFEESYVKLNLLLRDSFGFQTTETQTFITCKESKCKEHVKHCPKKVKIQFQAWYTWRPQSAIKKSSFFDSEQWIITLQKNSIHPLVQKWLEAEKFLFAKDTETLLIQFTNDTDEPHIRKKTHVISNPHYDSININKAFLEFCVQSQKTSFKHALQLITRLSKATHKSLNAACKFRQAICCFKEGFYLAPSKIPNAGYGLFSLSYIPPGQILFMFEGKRLLPSQLQTLSQSTRSKIELFAFEASFLIKEEKDLSLQDQIANRITLVFDPTNSKHTFTLEDIHETQNLAPWINEPPLGFLSNVFIQVFTCFDMPVECLERYLLFIVSARNINPHDELLLHYSDSYCRQGTYVPGECCPDLLPNEI